MIEIKPPLRVICFLLGLAILSVLIGTGFIGCKHPEMPPIDVSFWAGDSKKDGITRTQDHTTIPANDPRFDDMACLSYLDLKKIYSVLLSCKDWGNQPKASRAEIETFQRHNLPVIHHVQRTRGY